MSYCIAVAVYQVAGTGGFRLYEYVYYLVHFNISGPHYFVLLYLQLMLCSRFFYLLLQKCPHSKKGYIYEGIILSALLLFAAWTTNHTDILGVYGGGGKLLGGTYLVLYFFGMLIIKHGWLEKVSAAKSAAFFMIAGAAWFWLWRLICNNGFVLERYLPYGAGFNPPGVTLWLLACCMLFFAYGFFTLLEQNQYLSTISLLAGRAGTYTMPIFLYHRLFLDYYLFKYVTFLPSKQIWAARILYFVVMIAGSLMIEWIRKKLAIFVTALISD